MLHHQTSLRCTRTTATLFLVAIIALFILVGCASLFRSAGLTPLEAQQQSQALQTAITDAATEAVADVATGLAEGHDLKTLAINTGSTLLWKLIAAGGSAAGVILSGLLAKWLGTERKINKVLITGIESSNGLDIKSIIQAKAKAAGVEPKLATRVQAFT